MKKRTTYLFKRLAAACLAFGVAFTGTPASSLYPITQVQAAETASESTLATASQAAKYGLVDDIQDGAILHAWCWSFNTIKENMKDIAAAGFTTVQTSPANECKDTYSNMKLMGNDEVNGTDGCWWWQYQPTDWKIGNYQLGSRDDFKAMCAEADKYGIKVIVDVIPNHTTPDLAKVSDNLYNAVGGKDNLYHANGFKEITQWGNRYECTTGQMGGLPDVNTENPDFQAYFLKYLNDLIACGADGFRYDTAKHIGVPSDPTDIKSARNNFWPVVTGEESANGVTLSDKNVFTYGEVLQGDNVPESEYAKYMRMTASSYGETLRGAVTGNSFDVDTISNWRHASPGRLVTWVESHDTYCNAGVSSRMTDEQLRLAWAVIAARKDGTPLFYSRPDGSNGASGNRWGNNVLGAKGNNEFKSTEVREVNLFRNAMAGKSEYLRNPGKDSQILQIDRGNEGTVIINLKEESVNINSDTKMKDGTYKDQVSGRTFTVANGKISGSLDKRKVAVIYNKDQESVGVSSTTGSNSFSTDTLDVKLSAKNVQNATYTTSEGASGSYTDGEVIAVGAKSQIGDTITVTVKGTGTKGEVTDSAEFKKTEKDPYLKYIDGSYDVYIKKPDGWGDKINCYAYVDKDTNNGKWPGLEMKYLGEGVYAYNLPDDFKTASIIFNDGASQYPAAQQAGLEFTKGQSMAYINGSWTKVEKQTNDIKITSSLANGSSFNTDSTTTTITLKNATKGSYSVDDGPAKEFTGSATVTLGTGKIADSDVILKVTASNDKDSKTETFTFKKKFNAEKNGGYVDYEGETLATLGVEGGDDYATQRDARMTVNFGADRSAPQATGTALTLKAVADGGVGSYKYQFKIDNNEVQSGSSATYSWKAAKGAHTLQVVVTDSQGHQVTVSKQFTGEGGNYEKLNAKISASTKQISVGEKVKLTASATGGSGKYSYKFTLYKDGKWKDLQAYGNSTTYTWTAPETGKYSLYVAVNDSEGNHTNAYVPIEVKKEQLIVSLKASAKSVLLGEKVSLTAIAKGGSEKYSYKFVLYDNDKWKDLQTYGDSNTYTWTASKAGKYSLYVAVKDSEGNHTNAYVPIEVKNGQLSVSIEASTKSIRVGDKIKLTATAKGGSGKYSYKFVLYDNGKWKDLQTYRDSNTYTWIASKAGKYSLYVAVNDSDGKHINAYVPVEVKNGQLSVSIEASTKSISVGEKIKLIATAKGGSGKYSYKFVLYDNGMWKDLQTYGDSNTYTWTASKVGKYSLYVAVNDSDGNHINAYVPVEVKNKELTATLGFSISSSTGTSTVKLDAEATGGSGKYQYKFLVCNEKGMWEELRGYADSNSYMWNAKESGKYIIYVRVTDSEGGFGSAELPFYVIK